MIKTSCLSLTLALFLVSPTIFSKPSLKEDLQQIIYEYYKTHHEKENFTAISASVLVPKDKIIDKKEIHTVVIGTMGLTPFDKPITPDNVFEIGSITKSFTAFILLQLQTEGKLSLQDPLGKWLPQYPQWKNVTLRQLLNMTSSIPNYSINATFEQKVLKNLNYAWTNKELLTYAHPDKPLTKNNDNLYEYNNSNYILAALVIEKVTNDTFENQLKKRLLNQPTLANTYYPTGADGKAVEKAILKNKVHGYMYNPETKQLVDTINNDLSYGGAAGAIVATTENVVQWVQLLYHGTLINPIYRENALSELESIVSLKTGKPIKAVTPEDPAGFGLGIASRYDTDTKQRFWVYKGSSLGYTVMYYWKPCNNVTTVVAINSKGNEPIDTLNIQLYKAILKHNPKLDCRD